MANVKLKLAGLNKLMRSAPVQSLVNEKAGRISADAGPKYRVVVRPHRYTARAFVELRDGERATDADTAGLLGAIDSARS